MGRGSKNIFRKSARKHTACSIIHLAMKTYQKICPESIIKHEISDLSQQLPKSDESQDVLSNHNNKFQLNNLISDYLLDTVSVSKDIYVLKDSFAIQKNSTLPLPLSKHYFQTSEKLIKRYKIMYCLQLVLSQVCVLFQVIAIFIS